MVIKGTPSRISVFMAFLTLCISFSIGLTDSSAQSSCVSCHTKENLLKKNLAPKEEKKSALTSGAG
jgi:nitrate/TMAO reductase-like tetraheme cytochrome c subunit